MTATTASPAVLRAYRIQIDVEAVLAGEPSADLRDWPGAFDHHQTLVQRLLARPEVVDRLLRDAALAAAGRAVARLAVAPRPATEDLLRPLVAELDPAARRYFAAGLEDGASAICFDGVPASATAVQVVDVDLGAGERPYRRGSGAAGDRDRESES